jgi:hypothetical protein
MCLLKLHIHNEGIYMIIDKPINPDKPFRTSDKLNYYFGCNYKTIEGQLSKEKIEEWLNLAYAEGFELYAKNVERAMIIGIDVTKLSNYKPSVKNPVVKKNETSQKRAFDAHVARKYANKYQNAVSRGIEFDLSFTDMKELLKQKTCYYTRVPISTNSEDPASKLTIERIDGSKGYVKGNVAAVSHLANQWKANVIETTDPNFPKLSFEHIIAMLTKLQNRV